MTAQQLTYFTVTGAWYDVEAPLTSGSTNALQYQVVSAFVTFTPRLKAGTQIYVSNLDDGTGTGVSTALEIAPVTARIYQGQLATINQADTPGIQLLANTAILGLTSLIYDVSFTNVVYAGHAQTLQNFAFTAPTTAGTLSITDPSLTRLTYDPTNYT